LTIQVSQGEIVGRFRKTVVAGMAVSALALTTTVAYARDLGLNDFARQGSTMSSMSWGSQHGLLTDLSPNTTDVKTTDMFDGATATAVMISMGGRSYFKLTIRGIDESVIGKEYGAHLHDGKCVAGDGAAAGPHYNTTRDASGHATVISEKTEVWLDFDVNSEGNARTAASVSFVPPLGEHSIVIHASHTLHETGPDGTVGTAGARLACLPFTINPFRGSH
jgi:Cu/Zn superoxide dismutase